MLLNNIIGFKYNVLFPLPVKLSNARTDALRSGSPPYREVLDFKDTVNSSDFWKPRIGRELPTGSSWYCFQRQEFCKDPPDSEKDTEVKLQSLRVT